MLTYEIPKIGTVVVGCMRESERGFVHNGYVQGIVDALGHGPKSKSRHRRHYLRSIGHDCDRLLSADDTVALVARDDDSGALAYGFVLYAHGIVQWVYVKEAFRGGGLGRELLGLARLDGCARFAFHTRHDGVMYKAGLRYAEPERRGHG